MIFSIIAFPQYLWIYSEVNRIEAARSRQKLHILITLAVMVFIFIQSALSGESSGHLSGMIVSFLNMFMEADSAMVSLAVRKTAHFTEYLVLGACLLVNVLDWHESYQARKATQSGPAGEADRDRDRVIDIQEGESSPWLKKRQVWGLAWMLAAAYAVTDELHQRFVPDRSCEMRDVCIDAAGAAIGALIMLLITERRQSRK